RCMEEEGWKPDIDDIRSKVGEKVRGIVLINPNNPSGAVYSEKTVKEIIDVAGEHGIPVISDEIYDQIVYDGSFKSTASISYDVPVIGLNGLSKTYLITGWRLGYVYFYDPEGVLDGLKEGVKKMARMRLSVNTPAQVAGVAALNGSREHIKELVSSLRERRDYSFKRLNELTGVYCEKPQGAFYIFPKLNLEKWKRDDEFVVELLKSKGVLLVSGSGFGEMGRGHVRIVFLPPMEVLEEAFNKIEEFISSC
ncbi:MAG: aminotransferase class I/II-fold pyridoxal phosphate-dependent enzyme, partial [Candidatus Jordarchaeales archaeon]